LGAFVLAVLALWIGLRPHAPPQGEAASPLELAETTEPPPAFARALAPREFIFPRDLGPHPEYQTEWWYSTGTLETSEGARLGYPLTFFRRGLNP
jgi:predicted secreted hydrolase